MSKLFKNIYISNLLHHYSFDDEKEVSAFLFENTYLVDLLFEVSPVLKKYFTKSECRLSVFRSGIIQDQIMVRIYNDKDPDDNDRTLSVIDNVFWSKNISRARGKLVITA